jgi:hypothetical protein
VENTFVIMHLTGIKWYNDGNGVSQIFLPNGRWHMRQDPFADPAEDDSQEPDGSLPADGAIGSPEGLFLCLPAEQFDPDQFGQSGPAADMPPGALLATLMDLIAGQGGSGLTGLSDDQLIGVIAAARRMESRAAWPRSANSPPVPPTGVPLDSSPPTSWPMS